MLEEIRAIMDRERKFQMSIKDEPFTLDTMPSFDKSKGSNLRVERN
jgi:hypothetical protein